MNVETQAWREQVERLAFWIDRIASEESLQGRGNDEYFDINVRTSQLWNLHQAKDALTTQIEEMEAALQEIATCNGATEKFVRYREVTNIARAALRGHQR